MKKLIIASIVLIITLPIGLIMILGIVTQRMPYLGLLGEVRRTTGTVVGINTWTESGENYQSPQVQFTAENGQQISIDMVCAPIFDCFTNYEIGSKVPVIYPRNFPESAVADTFVGLIWTPICMLLLGVAFTLLGPVYLAIVISDRRERYRPGMKPPNLKRHSTSQLLR